MDTTLPFLLFALQMVQTLSQGDQNLAAPTQCQQDEPADRKACFVGRGLDLAVMPNNLDVLNPLYKVLESTFTLMDPHVHCSDPPAYHEAARCAINVSKTCNDPDGTRNVIMNPDDVIAGMQVLCHRKDDVDMACFKTFYSMVDSCVQYHTHSGDSISSAVGQSKLCATKDLEYDCMEVLMKPMCGDNTTHIFLQQLYNYTMTPACVNDTHPTTARHRYFPALVIPVENSGHDDDGRGGTTPLTPATGSVISLVAMALVFMFYPV